MFGSWFYNERIRRSVGAFGSLFNNINIIRKKKGSEGVSQIRVPLSYAPKRKYIERLNQIEKNEQNEVQVIALTLPRMSFEIVGINYDPSRQLPKMNYRDVPGSTKSLRNKIYTKTPYNIQFQLNIYAKTQDDALQIVEQIIPYFNPQYTLSMKPLDDYPEIVDDIPLILNGISFSDDYEGMMEQRRIIIYTIDFEMKIDFYGPTYEGAIIEQADITTFLDDSSSFTKYSVLSVTTNPSPVSPDSDYVFVETITLARDST